MDNKKKKQGRPKGTTRYGINMVNRGHWMTPRAHVWVRAHKAMIEELARKEEEKA